MLVGWYNNEVLAMPPDRHSEVFVLVPGWWSRFEVRRSSYVPSLPVFSYCTGIYKDCRDDRGACQNDLPDGKRVDDHVWFFAACRNDISSHSFGNIHFRHYYSGIAVLLPSGFLEVDKVLGLYKAIGLPGSDPVLCLLGLRRSQKINWCHYGGEVRPYFGCHFKNGKIYDISTFRANKWAMLVPALSIKFQAMNPSGFVISSLPAFGAANLSSST